MLCQVLGAPVETVAGSVPSWLSGTLVRHACGVLGETRHSTAPEFLNRVGHLFDCIEMGQAYHFHQGEVTFSSQFYDTTMVEVWLKYDQNMNQSSVFWGTIYGERNRTAMDLESPNIYKPGKHTAIPAVAWWKIGKDVTGLKVYYEMCNVCAFLC